MISTAAVLMIIEVYHVPNANLQAGTAEREGGSGVETPTRSARGDSAPLKLTQCQMVFFKKDRNNPIECSVSKIDSNRLTLSFLRAYG